ncbi:MAG: rod shape-determining protein MreD [Dehalococcoidia bacterium]|jgi:rod shape-determining protein MreD
MKYVFATLLLLLTALVQTSVMPAFPIFGVSPNLVLVLLVCWTVIRGRQEAMVVIPIGGLCLSLLGSQPVGVALLAAVPVLLLSELEALNLTPSNLVLALAVAFLSSLIYEAVLLVALRLEGDSVGWLAALMRVVIPTSIVNVVFTLPLYWLVWLRSGGLSKIRSYV